MTRRFTVRQAARAGFTLIETAIAMSIFTLLVLACATAFPAALRAGRAGSNYAQAALIAQHKIDQCRQQGYGAIYTGAAASPKLVSLGMVDAGSAIVNPAGYPAGSVSYAFTGTDGLNAGNFPPGTTGIVVIGPPNSGTAWTPSGSIVQVTVVIAWPTSTQNAGTFTAHTLIVNA